MCRNRSGFLNASFYTTMRALDASDACLKSGSLSSGLIETRIGWPADDLVRSGTDAV